MEYLQALDLPASTSARVLVIALVAAAIHFLVWGIRVLTEQIARPGEANYQEWARTFPKFVTVLTLVSSTLTFLIYFGAVGWILVELGVPVTAYVASASVIGLAVGFGSQGLVQDVVTGLSLIFTDALDVGDLIEVGGQTGLVHRVGLRYTILRNTFNQQVFLPNRNINQINQYPLGGMPVTVDLEIPPEVEVSELERNLGSVLEGMRHQYPSIILGEPRMRPPQGVSEQGWRYLRTRLKIWPGQGSLIESTLKQRLLAMVREYAENYPDWKITVTYRG